MPEQPLEILGKKKSGNIITSIGTSATLTSLGATAGAVMAIMTFLSYMHIDVIPFAWAADVESIQKSIDKLTTIVVLQNRTTLALQRDNYRLQLEEAEKELDDNPTSRSAKKEVDRLNDAIAEIDEQIKQITPIHILPPPKKD
jgi:hypothetical protein